MLIPKVGGLERKKRSHTQSQFAPQISFFGGFFNMLNRPLLFSFVSHFFGCILIYLQMEVFLHRDFLHRDIYSILLLVSSTV